MEGVNGGGRWGKGVARKRMKAGGENTEIVSY